MVAPSTYITSGQYNQRMRRSALELPFEDFPTLLTTTHQLNSSLYAYTLLPARHIRQTSFHFSLHRQSLLAVSYLTSAKTLSSTATKLNFHDRHRLQPTLLANPQRHAI